MTARRRRPRDARGAPRIVLDALLALATTHCGRVGYEPVALDGSLDALDAQADAPRSCTIAPDAFALGVIEPIAAANTASAEMAPTISPDDALLYFGSDRTPSRGGQDVYVASREEPGRPFGMVTGLVTLNTGDDERRLAIVPGGERGYFCSTRVGGAGRTDLWLATRSSLGAPFSQQRVLEGANTAAAECDPFVTPDGRRLYFAREQSPGSERSDLFVADLDETGSIASAIGPVPGVNSLSNDTSPALSPDERVIVFASDRPGGMGRTDLWYAARASVRDAFGTPRPLPNVNTTADESSGWLTSDGCSLYFASDRPGGAGGSDLYRAAIVPR